MRNRKLGIVGWLAAVIGLCLGAGAALAQPDGMDEKVSARAVAQHATVKPGGRVVVAIEMMHREGWHSWPEIGVKLPGKVAELVDANRTAVTIRDNPPPPASIKLDGVQYPVAHDGVVASPDGDGTVKVPLYSDTVVVYVRIEIAKDAAPGDVVIPLNLFYQSCNDKVCAFPTDIALDVPVKIVAASEPDGAPVEPALFAGFDTSKLTREAPPVKPDPGGGNPPTPTAPGSNSTDASHVKINDLGLGLSIDPSTPTGFVFIILLAFVGGFLLNLMPCVLPVIPIKILSLSKSAGNPRRCFFLGSVAAAGVVAAWLIVGVLSSLAGSAASQIYGYWWFSAGIGLFIAIMALSMLGLFTINLPQSAYMVNPSTDTARGSFIFGMFTVVLAVPCIAPFGGAAVGWAISQPMLTVLAVFLAVGAGMASPYLVLSARPSLIGWIPRTGPASELIKQVMGGLMFAMGIYFLGSGVLALLAEYPYLYKVLHWWIIAIVAGLTVLWMVVRTFQITKSPVKRIVFTLIGLGVLAMPLYFANQLTGVQHRLYLAKLKEAQSAPGHGLWQPYTHAAFEEARASGKVVVVDFTADWCLTCQFLKATVLSTELVEAALRRENVVSLLADLSSKKAEGNKLLRDLKAGGIPLLVVYAPGAGEPMFRSSGYTVEQIVKAVDDGLVARTAWLAEHKKSEAGWLDYSRDAFDEARARGDVVVVDFTAAWDINSAIGLKVRGAMSKPPEATMRAGVTRLLADVTNRDGPGNALLREIGANGVPMLAIYRPTDPASAPSYRAHWFSLGQVNLAVATALRSRGDGLLTCPVELAEASFVPTTPTTPLPRSWVPSR